MSSQNLPPLNALRAFEAAARTESFKKAADELCVTPSAVGHQVRGLEAYLGVRLFHRKSQRLRLSATGKHFSTRLREGFEILFEAAEAVRRAQTARVLAVSATPALALRWLAPKLERFRRDHPNIEFRLDASSREADLASGEADIDIRYGVKADPGLHVDVLFREAVFPVCGPALRDAGRVRTPADLRNAALIQVDDWGARGGVWRSWEAWFAVASVEGVDSFAGQRFMDIDMAVEAAAAGDGLAMGTARHLADPRFRERVVRPFDEALEVTYSAFMVALPEVAEERNARLFRHWILRSVKRESAEVIHTGVF